MKPLSFFVAIAASALMTANCTSPSVTAMCPGENADSFVAVIAPASLTEPTEIAKLAQAIDRGLMVSKATNVGVDIYAGASKVGSCGLADDARLAHDAAMRRDLGVTPLVSGVIAHYKSAPAAAPLDLAELTPALARMAATGKPTTVIVLASLQRVRSDDPFTAIEGGRYPGDGFLFAQPTDSVFSIVGRKPLTGLNVVVVDKDAWHLENGAGLLWRNHVRRFWAGFFTELDAQIAFGDSLEASLAAAIDSKTVFDDTALPPLNREGKMEMLSVVVPVVPAELACAASAKNLSPLRLDYQGPVLVGLLWDNPGIDLDLYVSAPPAPGELFYANDRVPGVGILEKRNAEAAGTTDPTGARGFEFARLDDAHLGKLQITINRYESLTDAARKLSVNAELRVAVAGQCRAIKFDLPASEDRGAGRLSQTRTQHQAWKPVDINQLFPGR